MPINLDKKTLTILTILLFLVVALFVGVKEYSSLSSKKTTTEPTEAERQIVPEEELAPFALTPEKKEIISKLETHTVTIQNGSLSPTSLTIKLHDQVKWQNNDNETYQIKGEDWGNVPIESGESFTQAFETAGTFSYSCVLHPELTGTIIVQ